MKILIIWPYFYPTPTAAAIRGNAFARYLNQIESIEVFIIAPRRKNMKILSCYKPDRDEKTIAVHRLPLLFDFKDIIKFPYSTFKLYKKVKDLNPDVIISSSTPATIPWQVSIIAKRLNIPFIMDVRDAYAATLKSRSNKPFRHKIANYIEQKSLKSADLIFSVTESLRKMIIDDFKIDSRKIKIVSNGIDFDQPIIKEDNRDIDAIFIGALDSLGRNSNQLISVCNNIVQKIPKTNFTFIGQNMEHKRNSKGITYVPPVPHSNISKWLLRSKIGLININRNDVFKYQMPVKVYEYIWAGLPVVALGPDDGELKKFVESNNVGMYSCNLTDFENSILDLIENDAIWTNFHENAIKISNDYNRKDIIHNAFQDYIKPFMEEYKKNLL